MPKNRHRKGEKEMETLTKKLLLMHFKRKLDQAQKEIDCLVGKPGLERDLQNTLNKRGLYIHEFEAIAKEIGVKIEL